MTNAMNRNNCDRPYILIEGPRSGDAEFYGKWLLEAAKANALWEEAIKDPSFNKQTEPVTVVYLPQFDHSASLFLFQLQKNLVSFTIPLFSKDWAELNQFVMMAEMGFFVRTGERYQMAIPTKLNMGDVKRAVLKLARTEDEHGCLYPEHLVTSMRYSEAREWQTRLSHMDENHRSADRLLLLS